MSKVNSTRTHIKLVLKMIEFIVESYSNGGDVKTSIKKILEIQERINRMLFSTGRFSFCCYGADELNDAMKNPQEFLESVGNWLDLVAGVADMIESQPNGLDGDFYALMTYISVSDSNSILYDMKKNLANQEDMKITIDFYNALDHLWGKLAPSKGIYDALEDRAQVLKEKEEDYIWLYERLADYRSKNVLFRTLQNWISFDHDELRRMKEMSCTEYCDFDILTCSDGEVFVDCGAYTGDSACNFIEAFKRYKRIYCYEAEPSNFKKMEENLAEYENIVLNQKAVGESYGSITISDDENGSSIYKGGGTEVDLVPMDEDIKEPITFVKMDIEGAEQAAIKGLKNHIVNDRPKLVICVYHGNRDLTEIPRLIDNIRDDYKFYLRNHGTSLLNIPVDTALYAV